MSEDEEVMDIEPIIPPSLPYGVDDKAFNITDPKTGEVLGHPYSYKELVHIFYGIPAGGK